MSLAGGRNLVTLRNTLSGKPHTLLPAARVAGARVVARSSAPSRSSPAAISAAPSSTFANFKIPKIVNEPTLHYAKNSEERAKLKAAITDLKAKLPIEVPLVIGGKTIKSSSVQTQSDPSSHATTVANYSSASPADVSAAIDSALEAKKSWEQMPFADRAAIFLKAADLMSGKYRYELMATTMLGQGKNAWQAEIDAAAELCDFLRFAVQYAEELYGQQPKHNAPGIWNRVEYRPLEGFVYAISPFNFTAIGGNLPAAPALMGNVALWKPSPFAMASNYLILNILEEAGLPPGVIQFVPGDAEEITKVALDHPEFAALHYTGSTAVFRSLYGKIASGVADGKYRSYPRIVGETGGKNYHLLHKTANVRNAALNSIRGAFEFQGQKCSATSRAYVPASLYDEFKSIIAEETEKLKMGGPEDFSNFIGPVIHEASFNKLSKAIDEANNDKSLELITGGKYDKSKGYFIQPSIYATRDPSHPLLTTELFGPVLAIHVYDDAAPNAFENICKTVDSTSSYGLTGSIFAHDRDVIRYAEDALRFSAGNFYINSKSTGSVVGQQPFGGARASGTNDKAGSMSLLSRFVSARSIKEEFVETTKVLYPSNEE